MYSDSCNYQLSWEYAWGRWIWPCLQAMILINLPFFSSVQIRMHSWCYLWTLGVLLASFFFPHKKSVLYVLVINLLSIRITQSIHNPLSIPPSLPLSLTHVIYYSMIWLFIKECVNHHMKDIKFFVHVWAPNVVLFQPFWICQERSSIILGFGMPCACESVTLQVTCLADSSCSSWVRINLVFKSGMQWL